MPTGKKYTYEEVYNYFKEHDCELLSKEYKNSRTHLEYKCNCGDISKIAYYEFKSGSRCAKCGDKKNADKLRLSYSYVYNYFKEHGCELLSKEYINNELLLDYKCECGGINKITFSNFTLGKRCKKCGIKKFAGDNHYLWNKDLTEEDRSKGREGRYSYNTDLYKWVKYTYKKDNYTCKKCNSRKDINNKYKKINAHHIYSWHDNPELRFEPCNGITLCKECHKEFHKQYGRGENNRYQLDKFMNNFNLIGV